MFESFIRRSIEAGLTDAWKKRTWRGMREEYLNSRQDLSISELSCQIVIFKK
jgi:hypothetical protein